ncbi:MAG: Glycerol acyltransferase [Bacteroidota bacterium]|nr:Glycerol acyltransferase [Bacteroidota bacterium]
MDQSSETKGIRTIDVEKVIRAKNPSLAKAIPPFIINYLKRVIHQDEINEILTSFAHLRDAEFIEATLGYLKIRYKVFGEERIPSAGRFIFVSNHPLGGLDGLVFIYEMSKHFSNIKFPVNDILTNIDNLSGIFLPVNKHGAQGREAAKILEETYASDCQILYFPAGLCSRKKRGIIRDLKWHKSFISKAIQHKRDIVPVYFSGRNSNFFYNLANLRTSLGIKSNFEMLYLPNEMFCQKGKEISLVFGKAIPWQTFDNSRSAVDWADWVKSRSYELEPDIKR